MLTNPKRFLTRWEYWRRMGLFRVVMFAAGLCLFSGVIGLLLFIAMLNADFGAGWSWSEVWAVPVTLLVGFPIFGALYAVLLWFLCEAKYKRLTREDSNRA